MHRRLLLIGVLVVCEVLWLLVSLVSAAGTPDYETYIAQQGETIASIAASFNVAPDALASYNRLGINDALTAGQIILVPNLPQPAATTLDNALEAEADTPAGEKISGKLATVTAAKAVIYAQPGPGRTLYDRATRGMDLLALGEDGGYYVLLMSDGNMGYIAKTAVSLSEKFMEVTRPSPPPMPATPPPARSPVIDTAMRYMGIPYQLGGRLPNSVDCSLLVQTVYAKHGVKLPRTAAQQYRVGQTVPVNELQAGDRLYFINRSGRIGHTGIYLGDGRFIHASSNRGKVGIDQLADPRYWGKYAGARR